VFSGQAFRPAFAKGERGTVPRRACELKGKCRESKETILSLRRRPVRSMAKRKQENVCRKVLFL
jgi:hypothetical protein